MFTHFVNLNVHKGKLAYLSHLASLSGMQERAVQKKLEVGYPRISFMKRMHVSELLLAFTDPRLVSAKLLVEDLAKDVMEQDPN